ncbi:MAG: YggS family pyridoxal phosphate-dependent enzyme [Tepidanaerobacter acetatoxydans]|jgi:pyridoxal phosphate enzyme (YggS family)|uniref:YggS family pyridoxal phosphate-dependent enzyme n=1 Tax=Tepidanaerobacter TaxID=499228 RepID=UPI000A822EB0|nr:MULTISPECIES: YggS family pyridoxal phosphate-dependent enzyme [Tepidanaerobacter]NLU09956.1 YggS family pyridoxal phosphate-dependent enzyme [Tepidanaerobacter acetatoxydans]
MSLLEENIANIKSRIKFAAERAGRNPENIDIVAVTKTIPPEIIQKAVDSGLVLLGENRVQEARDKKELVKGNVQWHLIGHLQRNKVKMALGLFSMIQSVDSLPLAEEIQKRAEQIQQTIDVLVQVNIGREKTKYGIDPDNTKSFIEKIALFPNLRVRGLMAIAPFKQNPEEVRPYFRQLREIFENIKQAPINNVNMEYLSMGMSNDFEVAVEEGANMVRIGTGVFGAREK